MDGTRRDEALSAIGEIFGNRMERGPVGGPESPLAVVSPVNAGEVELLAQVAHRGGAPLVAVGAGTAPVSGVSGAVMVRFDLMREVSVGERPEDPVEVGPGISWVHLEDHLRGRGAALRVYPTSAPWTTVGGWLALDGLGVGSYEFGRLRENVASVEVVEPGGARRRLDGEELRDAKMGPSILVGASLETRPSAGDVPFGAAFDAPDDLVGAVGKIAAWGVPLWHLGLANGVMARALGHGRSGEYVLFGAYPGERAPWVEGRLWEAVAAHRGRRLPTAETYRIWGSRFYPADPSKNVPRPGAVLVPRDVLGAALWRSSARLGAVALMGSVSRTGEALLLAFGHDAGAVSELGYLRTQALVDLAREQGGREYRTEPPRDR